MEVEMKFIFSLLCIFVLPPTVISIRNLNTNPCERTTLPFSQSDRPDQLTVLINGYSESRIPHLHSIAAAYAASSLISAVVILWGNPSTPHHTFSQLSHNLSLVYSASGTPITVHSQKSSSLNSRFLPRHSIKTRAVLISDDDIEVDSKSVEFAFRTWESNQDRLIGFFARSHDLDLIRKTWIYTVHPNKFSIILTKFMILKNEYLYQYSCKEEYGRLRDLVQEMNNCEDILMNFVVADSAEQGPVMVAAEKVRDWGDARNDGGKRGEEVAVGLSSVNRGGGEHRKRRGECIKEFHKVLGRMPLRYSHGKVVNSVGEQGLCEKGGKLAPCDQQMHGMPRMSCFMFENCLGNGNNTGDVGVKGRQLVTSLPSSSAPLLVVDCCCF